MKNLGSTLFTTLIFALFFVPSAFSAKIQRFDPFAQRDIRSPDVDGVSGAPDHSHVDSSSPNSKTGVESSSQVICRIEGLCERCPESSINEPFCQPYGNRRLIKCLPKTPENERLLEEAAKAQAEAERLGSKFNWGRKKNPTPKISHLGETPAWEACGKVIAVERADFWEFLLCNLIFVSLSLFVVLARSKKLAAIQYRKLVARIGL
ncbi:hypothetical protein FRC03_004066 [Tulasnella sp. 419]|nr:hypothetical protein FRC03_004066 [Tulasnella sp. 419]